MARHQEGSSLVPAACHAGEAAIREMLDSKHKGTLTAGLEGNAQSFRIVTKLGDHYTLPWSFRARLGHRCRHRLYLATAAKE
jgi:dGTP triphosphohydrolase